MFPGVVCVDVSVEAKLLAAGSDDGVVSVWSLADQQLLHSLLGHTGESDRGTHHRWTTVHLTLRRITSCLIYSLSSVRQAD